MGVKCFLFLFEPEQKQYNHLPYKGQEENIFRNFHQNNDPTKSNPMRKGKKNENFVGLKAVLK